jgi:hypothetical protein
MSTVGGCSSPSHVHTVAELQDVVLMSFGYSLTHLPLGIEVGSEGGWAPESAGLASLNSCKSTASSSSHACGQYKTSPLVKELAIPSGLGGAAAALPNCLLGCETVPASERVAPFTLNCKSTAAFTSSELGVYFLHLVRTLSALLYVKVKFRPLYPSHMSLCLCQTYMTVLS